jgi:uncharacterized membrane protein
VSENLNEQVVVAFFDSPEKADDAAQELMKWDKANDAIKLGTIGRLVLDEDGKLKGNQYSGRHTGTGALVGGALGVVAAAFTGGLSLLAGAVGGGAIGGVTGHLTKGSFGLTDAVEEKIKTQLTAGSAALVVLCDDYELNPTMDELRKAGGDVHSFGVSSEVLNAIHETNVQHYREDIDLRNLTGPV